MDSADGVRIRVTRDGPYVVLGAVPLSVQRIAADEDGESASWEPGAEFEARERCSLCRCGESGSKPYCDGSHVSVSFDGTETASFESYETASVVLEGPRVDVRDQEDICAEARFCHRAGTIWHRVENDDDESERIVVEECDLCPSGRYTAVDKVTRELHEPDLPPSIGLVQDLKKQASGPLWIRGGIAVESAEGREYPIRNRVTLCRCGHSKNKPFCDGSHLGVHFHDHL